MMIGHNQAASLLEITEWRHQLHAIPEPAFGVEKTAGFVAEKLRSFGCDQVDEGVGISGVVGVIKGRDSGATIALRADMDGLPIEEGTGLSYASAHPGRMHACGHDGHTAMLLGAAERLARHRDFRGTVVLVFQPAEEDGGGAEAMLRDRLIERYGIERVFGMHNRPGLPVGQFAIRTGVLLAATADFDIVVSGVGGHAARPQDLRDPILAAGQLLVSLQSVVSRHIDPVDSAVLSVTTIHGGDTYNVIPGSVTLTGTVRCFRDDLHDRIRSRMESICDGTALTTETEIRLDYRVSYPVTENAAVETELAIRAASKVAGPDKVDDTVPASLGSEDFSYLLKAAPGAYIFLGNGDSGGLHHPSYDFNDEAIPYGVDYWVSLVNEVCGRQ